MDKDLESLMEILTQTRIVERKDIITGRFLPTRLEARAAPNHRLKLAFGIDNAFTATDQKHASKFIGDAKRKLQDALGLPGEAAREAKADWQPLLATMRRAVARALYDQHDSVDLAKTIQFVTLKVTLEYLFGLPPDSPDTSAAIAFVANKINELWLDSKTLEPSNRHNTFGSLIDRLRSYYTASEALTPWRQQKEMHENLLKLVPHFDPLVATENPMNYILPAYETMWRAVYRGLLEIHFTDTASEDSQAWKDSLNRFFQNPIKKNWKEEDEVMQLSALNVTAEIFRLYPPTRRIYRKYPNKDEFVKADLERLHRNPLLAPYDPETFRPERWLGIKEKFLQEKSTYVGKKVRQGMKPEKVGLKDFEEDMGFMPFAKICPAGGGDTQAFGWKMIALLIAALMEGFNGLAG
jgi:Fe-S-cluster formation regulator IscX/YfhJ